MNLLKYLILAVSIVCLAVSISFRFWATDKALEIEGPSFIQRGPNDSVSILIQNQILVFDVSGEYLRSIQIADFGKKIHGNFGYFPNGDLLFYHYTDEPSLVDSIATFLRLEDMNNIPPNTDEGFYRCSLTTSDCARFTAEMPAIGDHAFGLEIDQKTSEVYVSATAKHELFKFSEHGKLLARASSGLKFPNTIKLRSNRLYVADTNNHRVKVVDPSDQKFGEELLSHRTVLEGTEYQWPSGIEYAADGWWVLISDSSMGWGRIIRYSPDWSSSEGLDLPRGAWPIGMAYFDDTLWVTDLERFEIYRYSLSGEKLVSLDHSQLRSITENAEKHRSQYETYSVFGLIGLILSLVFGLGGVYVLDKKSSQAFLKGEAATKTKEFEPLDFSDGKVQWFESRSKKFRLFFRIIFIGWYAIFLLGLVGAIAEGETNLSFYTGWVVWLALFAMWDLVSREMLLTEIGFKANTVLIKSAGGRVSERMYKDVLYGQTHIIVGDQAAFIGRSRRFNYEPDIMNGHLVPRLATATRLSFFELFKKLMMLGHPYPYALLMIAPLFLLSAGN